MPALAHLEALASWGRGGGKGCRGLCPLCGMEPPAAACHVVQHVTALLGCCLERSQAEAKAERVPGGAGLRLSLQLSAKKEAQRGTATGLKPHSQSGPTCEVLEGKRSATES